MVVGDWDLTALALVNDMKALKLTARLQLHISLLHNAKVWVAGEHLRPFFHALQDLGFDLLMCVLLQLAYCIYNNNKIAYSFIGKSQQRLREAPRCQLAMNLETTILRKSVC
jgi:hypothetical protein